MPLNRQITLKPPGNYPFLRGPLGRFILTPPWFDTLSFYLITRGLMPLSRSWAEAVEIVGSEAAYEDAMAGRTNLDRRHRKALALIKQRKDAYDAADAAWKDALFGGGADVDRCTRLEFDRQRAAHLFMITRVQFKHRWGRQPAMRWDLPTEREVMHKHGHRLKGREAAFPVPEDIAVEKSHPVRGAYGPEYWLRFPSPSATMGDTAWTHVYEPEDAASDPPTLIFLHGICMEPEMWKAMVDPVTDIARRGVRVVRPEGPWHGRRMKPGFYGGEPAIAQGPMGMIDLFEAWVAEIAVLIRWARETSRGPVAIGGLSLGALAAQLAATAAVHWPDELKPDAKILMVTSGDIMATAYHGALPAFLGLPERLGEMGWTDRKLKDWLTLLQPMGHSAVAPDRTIMLLGEADVVTPFEGGRKLAEDWYLPPENLFIRRGGHFSTPLSQYYDRAPLDRLYEVLR